MTDHQTIEVKPESPPLSHLGRERRLNTGTDTRVYMVLGLVLVSAILFLVFWGSNAPSNDLPTVNTTAAERQPSNSSTRVAETPFAETQRQRAREQAQVALAQFVERQIQLEDNMQVQVWGAELLAEAVTLAQEGDLHFAAEDYAQAITTYEQAATNIAEVIATGEELVAGAVASARSAIDQRQTAQADTALTEALLIQPNHPERASLTRRIANLEQVISLIRTAKNHQLAGRFQDALDTYQAVRTLDPETTGLAALEAEVRQAAEDEQINQYISQGFAQLNSANYSAARQAFQNALNLAPDNPVAQGGLEQVSKEYDLDQISKFRNAAQAAMANERWDDAMQQYQAILNLDNNIQFASSGLDSARAHNDAEKLLTAINKEPTRLSNQTLYLQAQDILTEAQSLSHIGNNLQALLTSTETLLVQYRDPVAVTLISDNATDITISNIGRVGFFERKDMTLRPGQYTIRGSQAGCRDIYLTVLIVPGVEQLDLSCQERL